MADNILKQSLDASTPLFDTIFGTIQNELAKIEQNRQIAKQFAQRKELINYEAGIGILGAQKKADIQLQKQKDYFDYQLENTPDPTPETKDALTEVQKHNMIMDVTRLFNSQAQTATKKLGIPDLKVHTVQTEEGVQTVIGQKTEEGVVPYNNLLQQYTIIENAENIKQNFIKLQNEGKLNVDTVKIGTEESNGVLYVGRDDVHKILNFNPYQALDNPDELTKMMSFVETYGSNIQPNTLPEEEKDSETNKIKNIFRGHYSFLSPLSQPSWERKTRLSRPGEGGLLKTEVGFTGYVVGDRIKELEQAGELTASQEQELNMLFDIVSNYGKLGEGFSNKNPRQMVLNPDQEEVTKDPTKILITKEEYEQKVNNQRAGKDLRTGAQSVLAPVKQDTTSGIPPSIFGIKYGDGSGN